MDKNLNPEQEKVKIIYINQRGPLKTKDEDYKSKYYLANRKDRLEYQYIYNRVHKHKIQCYNKLYWLNHYNRNIEDYKKGLEENSGIIIKENVTVKFN